MSFEDLEAARTAGEVAFKPVPDTVVNGPFRSQAGRPIARSGDWQWLASAGAAAALEA
jgi:hypothetical protein